MEKPPPPSCPAFAPVLDPKPAAMPGAWPPTPLRLFKRTRNSTFSRLASAPSRRCPPTHFCPADFVRTEAKPVLYFLPRTLVKRPHARTHYFYPHSTCIDDILVQPLLPIRELSTSDASSTDITHTTLTWYISPKYGAPTGAKPQHILWQRRQAWAKFIRPVHCKFQRSALHFVCGHSAGLHLGYAQK
ncbi:hypothetical protein K438DRAFT_1767048 [Mycena galopus ATCC 62051]|nr:hypothetical protein K438DRAFT_1767048 [Mycena galopus ATCC 62051]